MNLTSLFSMPDPAQAAVQSGGGIQVSQGVTGGSKDNSPSVFQQVFRSAAQGEHIPATRPFNGSQINQVEFKADSRALSEAQIGEKDVSQLLAELISLFQNLMAQNQVEPSEEMTVIGDTPVETNGGSGGLSTLTLFVDTLRAILEKAVQDSGLNGEQDERLYTRLMGMIEGFNEDPSGLLQQETASGLSATESEGLQPSSLEIIKAHETAPEESAIPLSPEGSINSSQTAWPGDGSQNEVVGEEGERFFQGPFPAARSYEIAGFGNDSGKIKASLSDILAKLQAEYETSEEHTTSDAGTGDLNGDLVAQLQLLYQAVSALSDAGSPGSADTSGPESLAASPSGEVHTRNNPADFLIQQNFQARLKHEVEGGDSPGQNNSASAATFDRDTAGPDPVQKDMAQDLVQLSSLKNSIQGLADDAADNINIESVNINVESYFAEPGVERVILPHGDKDTIEIFYSDSDTGQVPENSRQRGAQRPVDNTQVTQTVVSQVTVNASEDLVESQPGDSVGPVNVDNDESAGFGGSSATDLSSPNSMDRVASAADSRGMPGNNQNESTSQHGFNLGASIAPADSDIRPDNESLSRLPQLVKQLEHGVTRAVRMNRNRAVLHLNPPELGSVTVRLSVHGNNEVRAVFLTDNPDTRHLIASGMDSLRNHLASNGFSLTGADVGNNSMHADSGQGGSQGFGDPRHDSSVFNEEVTATEQPVASTFAEESRLLHMIV